MKRGSISDVFFIMVFIMLTAIIFVTGWMMMSKVNDALQDSNIADAGKTLVQNTNDRYVGWMDGIFLSTIVLLWAVALILAYNIDTSPVFFIFSIIVYAVLIIITAIFGNTFYDFASNANVSAYANAFTILPFVMNHFVTIMVVIGFSVAAVLYGKARG